MPRHSALVSLPPHIPKPGFPPRPIPNSYWATPLVLACEYPFSSRDPVVGKQKLSAVLRAGVRTFIDLTHPTELMPYELYLRPCATELGIPQSEQINYYRFPIPNGRVPKTVETLDQIFRVLEDCERRGVKAAVHCWGGVGRTGTIVACWLLQSGTAANADEALAIVAEEWRTVGRSRHRPNTPETQTQLKYVRDFQRHPRTMDSTTRG